MRARASKAHKQSRDGEEERVQEEIREIFLVLSTSIIMMIASSSHTYKHMASFLSLRLNPLHRAIVRSRHPLSTLCTHIYIYIYYEGWIKKTMRRTKTRRSLILVAPTKSSCMRMMLINEDNERAHLVRTRIPLRWESITAKEKSIWTPASFYFIYLLQWSIYRWEKFSLLD
jgi:hypothetical protein